MQQIQGFSSQSILGILSGTFLGMNISEFVRVHYLSETAKPQSYRFNLESGFETLSRLLYNMINPIAHI